MEFANVNITSMSGFLTKIDDVWSVSYWRQVNVEYELKSFTLPLYYDDIYAIEAFIKSETDYKKILDASVNFEIIAVPSLLGNIFMAKLKLPYETIKSQRDIA